MIDEYWTWVFYGYHSDELKTHSHKPIVARCEDCCQYRVLAYRKYNDLCWRCAMKSEYVTEETRRKMSASLKGKKMPPWTKEQRQNTSIRQTGRTATDATREKMSKAQKGKSMPPHTEERKRKISAAHQGIPYEKWDGYISNGNYCEKFDEACRERIRAKYDYKCFVCDKPQNKNTTKNGKNRKLSVHHVDMDKSQGCDGINWKLVPLCMQCHPSSHFEPLNSRIEYLLDFVWL